MTARLIERLWAALDRRGGLVASLACAAIAASLLRPAMQKPFWHDEIYTIALAGQPSMSAIWAAARDGIDLAGLSNVLLTREAVALAGSGRIAVRLPGLLAYLATCLVLFHIVRQRSSVVLGLAAALLPCFTALYRYSYEARGYALLALLFALELWAWSSAARGRSRAWALPALALSIAAGFWTHLYAVLTLVPLAAGELVRTARSRRLDRGVWIAMAVGCAGALPLVPLVRVAAARSATFWTHPALADICPAYRFLIDPLLDWRFAIVVPVVAALAVWSRWGERSPTASAQRLPAHEVAAGIAALAVPAMGVLVAMTWTGAFTPRYGLPAVVGLALVAPLLVGWVAPGSRAAELVVAGALASSFAPAVLTASRLGAAVPPDPVQGRPLLQQAVREPGPLVASGSLLYLQLWYYMPAADRVRLQYLADPVRAFRLTGSDTIDRGYLALSRIYPVSVEPYQPFVDAHAEFRVYDAGSGWLLRDLRESGAQIRLLARGPDGRVYLVRPRSQLQNGGGS